METESHERYTKEEFDGLEKHIEKHFGKIDTVFHEIVSPDIHVDVAIIKPAEKRLFFFNPRPYYTLVTMGMGAHRMAVPETFREKKLECAELLITLLPDWKIGDADEQWYWPIRLLKFLARFPLNENTWLGWGHTVANGEPFANNTKLSGMLLEIPHFFGTDSQKCHLPGGREVNFYQLVPLYDEEIEFKIRHGLDALAERFPDTFDMVVNIARENVCGFHPNKNFAISAEETRPLLENRNGPQGCIATDRIMVDGRKVGYMYRETPDFPGDSGWRFTAGDEEQAYMDIPENSGLYELNTLCNYDPDIIAWLDAPVGAAFIRDESGNFVETPLAMSDD